MTLRDTWEHTRDLLFAGVVLLESAWQVLMIGELHDPAPSHIDRVTFFYLASNLGPAHRYNESHVQVRPYHWRDILYGQQCTLQRQSRHVAL